MAKQLPTDAEIASFFDEASGPSSGASRAAKEREEVLWIIALVVAAFALNSLLALWSVGAGWSSLMIAIAVAPALNALLLASAIAVYYLRLRSSGTGSALPLVAVGVAVTGCAVVFAVAMSFSGGGC